MYLRSNAFKFIYKIKSQYCCCFLQAFLSSCGPLTGYQGPHDLMLTDDFPRSIDCGPKLNSTQYYNRDYMVDRSVKKSAANWPVHEQKANNPLVNCDINDSVKIEVCMAKHTYNKV